MQASLLSGIITNKASEFAVSYPTNLEPIIVKSGISQGQLRGAMGSTPLTSGPGVDRGGIVWNDVHYRIMGTSLVRVDAGLVTILGDVGGDGEAGLDYSFDNLIIRSSGLLWYWNGTTLTQVTDPDLGVSVDAMWIDGYTMSTDGQYVAVTELSDPLSVKTGKYGSAEADPDPVTGLIRASGEAYVLGRHTIQALSNQGGTGFPFAVVAGATIQTGCVSASAKVLFGNSFAFVGSSRGEALGVHVAGQGKADKISTRAVDDALAAEADPTAIVLEKRVSRDELRLYVHLSTETWVFLAKTSTTAGEPVWYRCQSGLSRRYRLRHAVLVGSKMIVGDTDSAQLGIVSDDVSSHFGDDVQWSFDVGLIYNKAKGAIVDRIEMVGLPSGGDGVAFMSMTRDGETFTPERAVSIAGPRTRRVQWRPHVRIRNYMGLRFRGYGSSVPGFASCEVEARPLSV